MFTGDHLLWLGIGVVLGWLVIPMLVGMVSRKA